jgi:hypothetical protein
MNQVKVKNWVGTGDNKSPSGSWLKDWEKHKIRKDQKCSNINCPNKAEVGGHVKKVGSDNSQYIIPICSSCNALGTDKEYTVDSEYLVPVSKITNS